MGTGIAQGPLVESIDATVLEERFVAEGAAVAAPRCVAGAFCGSRGSCCSVRRHASLEAAGAASRSAAI